MKKFYVNIRDRQGGTWYLGVCNTIKEWKETALMWCDSNGNEELYKVIKKHKLDAELIDMISDIWSMEIVEVNIDNYYKIANNLDCEDLKPLLYTLIYNMEKEV